MQLHVLIAMWTLKGAIGLHLAVEGLLRDSFCQLSKRLAMFNWQGGVSKIKAPHMFGWMSSVLAVMRSSLKEHPV